MCSVKLSTHSHHKTAFTDKEPAKKKRKWFQTPYHKSVSVFQVDLSQFSEAAEEFLYVAFPRSVRQPSQINTAAHGLKRQNFRLKQS